MSAKIYYEKNKKEINQQKRLYYLENQQQIIDKQTQYYILNRTKILQRNDRRLWCDCCQTIISYGNFKRHLGSMKHQKYLLNNQ